jgi:SAM-dependent methyltransferase
VSTASTEHSETAAAALARLYDLDLADDPGDLDLYLALAGRTGGPVLELGTGSGRVAVPLAAAGFSVSGVDLDPAMLARARVAAAGAGRGVAKRLRLVEGDARSVRLDDAGGYGLAVIPLNSIFLFGGRADQAASVATLAAHLAPGGVAVVDCWLPDADDLARYDGRLILEWVREEPETGHTVTKTGAAWYDAALRVVRLTTVFEASHAGQAAVRWVRQDRLRLVDPDELSAFAEAAGLHVELVAGGYELEPLDSRSDRVVMVARRP